MGGRCQKVEEDLLAAKGNIILRTLLDCQMFAEAVKLVHLFLGYGYLTNIDNTPHS